MAWGAFSSRGQGLETFHTGEESVASSIPGQPARATSWYGLSVPEGTTPERIALLMKRSSCAIRVPH